MSSFDYDVLIIGGGGSGGFTAATTALQTGAKVAMVESGRLGGLCILAGCMPSKTLLHHAAEVSQGHLDGTTAYPRVLAHKRQVVDDLAENRERAVALKEEQGLVVLRGRAVFVDEHSVSIDGRRVTAAKLVVATGSSEVIPAVPGLEECPCLTGESFMDLSSPPESLIVLGGGTVALEMAQYAARMGVTTTMIQRSPRLLSKEDPRVGRVMAEALDADGVRVVTDTELIGLAQGPGGKLVSFIHEGQETSLGAEHVLIALGRRPNSEGLNLEAAGVELGRGGAVLVDQYMTTNQPHIFAAGDVTGVNMVVNLAVMQGEVAGYNATHPEPRAIDDRVLPQAVFTDPQYAKVGLTRSQCEERGIACVEASYELAGMGVAKTYPRPLRGFCTLRAAPDGRLLGAELVAPEASLMIHDVAVALKLGGRAADLADLPYIHPTLAEIVNFTASRLVRKLDRK